jgi:CubicO group peptidase (beta-lactamase class C family)
VDEQTIYHWASVTKTFTAVAIMQLRERGLLRLDDPVVRYVPELREVYNPYSSMEAITLRHLLSHSAGFRSGTWPWGGDEPWHPHEPTEWSQLVAMIPYTRINFAPGSRYTYSNPGIVFLGRTLEKVTGDVYEAYIDKNIFRPLDMRRSYFDGTPWHLLPYRSNNYRVVEGRPVANGLDFNTGITVSNGGLNAPVGDLAKWLGFLMGTPGARRPLYEGILPRAALEEMWKPVVPVGESPLGAEAMGLSFFLYEQDGHRIVGHTGSQKSFRSFILFDPVARVGMIGAFNTADGDESAPDTSRLLNELRVRAVREVFPMFRGEGGVKAR